LEPAGTREGPGLGSEDDRDLPHPRHPASPAGALTAAIGILGFGEAGSLIAADLVAAGADVRGFDPRVPAPPGVAGRADDANATRDADLVLSLTGAHEAREALDNALPALRRGTVWAELNTTSPGLKRELAEVGAGHGVEVVDVALMAPVPGNGLRTPMVAAGPAAPRVAGVLAVFGATVEVVAGPVGTAISRKLLRSVFYKGLAAAVLEALAGAEAAGCADWLRANLAAELVGFDERTLDRLVTGSQRHARRRVEEMAAAAQQLRELGVEPRVAGAAQELLRELARAGTAAAPEQVLSRRSASAPR
jgi:3-hydroxyisobutyrate dehydrogenase-like beta-hydroxyacid dehydrogenase